MDPLSDHPIFSESIRRIRELLRSQGAADSSLAEWLATLGPLERDVLERCIHSSGDPSLAGDLRFSPPDGSTGVTGPGSWPGACGRGLAALRAGAPILTDTAMAAAAVAPMARRTLGNRVVCLLDWAPPSAPPASTRSAAAMEPAWQQLTQGGPAPLVLIGSAPTALEALLQLVASGAEPPSLIIGMPVGFVGVAESKRRLAQSGLSHIRLEGSRGGAGLVAAACNALLRAGGRVAENPQPLS